MNVIHTHKHACTSYFVLKKFISFSGFFHRVYRDFLSSFSTIKTAEQKSIVGSETKPIENVLSAIIRFFESKFTLQQISFVHRRIGRRIIKQTIWLICTDTLFLIFTFEPNRYKFLMVVVHRITFKTFLNIVVKYFSDLPYLREVRFYGMFDFIFNYCLSNIYRKILDHSNFLFKKCFVLRVYSIILFICYFINT